MDDLATQAIQFIRNSVPRQLSVAHFPTSSASNSRQQIRELLPRQVRMNRYMELQYQVECLQDVAVVNCSGRMVRGAALDEFRRRIEKIERVRVLVLDVSKSVNSTRRLGNPVARASLGHAEEREGEAGKPAAVLPEDARGHASELCVRDLILERRNCHSAWQGMSAALRRRLSTRNSLDAMRYNSRP